jgi:hypothetical protein
MAISGASVPLGATWAPTGGAAKTFVSMGFDSAANKQTLYLDESLDLLLRKTAEFSSRPPVPQLSAPNGYSQQRCVAVYHSPILLANGKTTVNTVTVTIAYDPETDAAERTALREFLSWLGDEADFDGWIVGAVA